MSRIARHMLSQNIHGLPWSSPMGLLPEDPPSGGTGGGGGGGGTGSNEGGNPDEKQLPQSKVNEIVAQRTTEAKNKALADLAEELGVSIDDAKRIVKERKEADERNQSELEKERNARAQAEKDRDTKVSDTQRELHSERADRALVAAGVPDDDAKLTRLRGMLTVEVGASKEDIRKDVEKLKADFPGLFEEQAGKTPRPSTDPKARPTGPKVGEDAYRRGAERAATRYKPEDGVERLKIPGVLT